MSQIYTACRAGQRIKVSLTIVFEVLVSAMVSCWKQTKQNQKPKNDNKKPTQTNNNNKRFR